MDYHHHARLTIYSREQMAKSVVEGRLSLREAAAERGLSRQSAAKWVRRFREGGVRALQDRSRATSQLTARTVPGTGSGGSNGCAASAGPACGSLRALG